MTRFMDLTGRRFGRLVALSRAPNKGLQTAWNCRCDCGNEKVVVRACLTDGRSQSCGCLHKEVVRAKFTTHGRSDSRAFKTWVHMRDRCNNPSNPGFHNYGGRGIGICERWSEFANFYEDMGDPPVGFTLDRIDNEGGYCKENCRWADKKTQAANTRKAFKVHCDGEVISISELARREGRCGATLRARARRLGSRDVPAEYLLKRKRRSKLNPAI